MLTLRRLLRPVDLSAASAAALRYATGLRSVLHAELSVLLVGASPRHDGDDVDAPALAAFMAATVGSAAGLHRVHRQGQPTDEILRAAAVVRHSATPVLVVPGASPAPRGPATPGTVLCAVDFSASSPRAIEHAASFAAGSGARLLLAHVLEWSEEQDPLPSTDGHRLPTSEDDALARLNELITDEMRAGCSPAVALGYGEPGDELLRLGSPRTSSAILI